MSEPTSLDPRQYAGWRTTPLGAVSERLEMDLLFELAGPVRGKSVLDVGTGDGSYAREAAARGAHVAGVDADAAMLRAARDRADSRGLSFELTEGRVESLPFEDNTFDVVFAVTVLCFVGDAERAVQEMARVLVPGGRLVLGELGRFSTWAAWRRVRGWLGSATWRRARFRTAREVRRLLCEAGLDVERITGAIYYPPIRIGAQLLAPIDRVPAAVTTLGAAFLAAAARKPQHDNNQGEPS